VVLEHVAEAPVAGGHVDARGGVEERLAREGDAAAVGREQPGDRPQGEALAGSGGTVEDGAVRAGPEAHGEVEAAPRAA
jgi:hypothetical protein